MLSDRFRIIVHTQPSHVGVSIRHALAHAESLFGRDNNVLGLAMAAVIRLCRRRASSQLLRPLATNLCEAQQR